MQQQASSPKKFKFFLQHFRPKAYSSTSLLKKLRPKIRSLVIPLKGSSSFGDYVLTDILKHPRQLPPSSLKTLQKLKTWFLSDEFLQFFINNKQILKNVRAFKANINNFSHKRAHLFTTFLNRMSNLNKFDDTAKFCVQKPQVQPKTHQFAFPGRNTLKTTGRGELSPKPAAIGVLLKNLYALRKVQEVRFTPNLNFKKVFPMVKRLEIEACYLEKLPLIKGKRVEELRITDISCGETVVLPEEEVLSELEKFRALKKVTVEISDEDNMEILEVVKYLPKQEIKVNVSCDNGNQN